MSTINPTLTTSGPAEAFVARASTLTVEEIREINGSIRRTADTADGEVAWWKATVTVSCSLRRMHRSREAGLAAHRAVAAVQAAAARAGLGTADRDAVTTVARAAAEVARALVAEAGVAAGGGAVDACSAARTLLAPWTHRPVAAA
jgi:hypothetical protein